MFISFRTYFFIALVVGGSIYLISQFAGPDIYDWAQDQQREARLVGARPVGQIVMGPIEFVFNPDNQLPGAILTGLLWPLVIIWPVLIFFHFIIVALSDAVDDAALEGMIHWVGW